jgi:hypothetical protein
VVFPRTCHHTSEATEIGAAIRHRAGSDHDTGVPTQPYRIAGTPNFPGRAKQARGRIAVHPTRILEHTAKVYSAAELHAAFPQPKKTERKNEHKADDNIDWRIAEESLPNDLKYLIQHGAKIGQRSAQFHHVVGWLKRLGWSAATVVSLLANYPDGIANKFKERLEQEVNRSFEKCEGPSPQEEQGKENDDKDLHEMNAAFAVVKVSGKTRVAELEESSTYPGCRIPVFSTIADFCAFHAKNKKLIPTADGKGLKEVGLGRWWIDHPQRRQYDGIVYAPHGAENGRLNLWTGYSCERRAGNCNLYLTHLRNNICSGNEEHTNYLLNWMSDAVQHPDKAGEVAVVLRGAEGVGKGALVKQFGWLFGPHFRHITQAKHLVGHFNAHLQQCSVLFADEAFFAGDRAHEGILKALITEETLLIEPKGVDTFAVRNSLHIILSSNNEWVIPAGADARRFFVLDVASTHMRDYPYFAAISDEMDNGGREALLDHLLKRDLTKFNVRLVPQTPALANQKAYSRRGIDRLIEILAQDGILPCADASDPSITITTGEDKGEGFYRALGRSPPTSSTCPRRSSPSRCKRTGAAPVGSRDISAAFSSRRSPTCEPTSISATASRIGRRQPSGVAEMLVSCDPPNVPKVPMSRKGKRSAWATPASQGCPMGTEGAEGCHPSGADFLFKKVDISIGDNHGLGKPS